MQCNVLWTDHRQLLTTGDWTPLKVDIGLALIPGVPAGAGSMCKVAKALTPAQQSRVNAIDNIISSSAKSHDFTGVAKELQGIKTGYDHVTEMKQSVRGLEKAIRGIEGSLKNPNLEAAARSSFEAALKRGRSTLDKMNKTLSGG